MDVALLRSTLQRQNWRTRRMLRDLTRYPTERNTCFAAGYVGALQDTATITSEDAAFLRALIGQVEVVTATLSHVLSEMET